MGSRIAPNVATKKLSLSLFGYRGRAVKVAEINFTFCSRPPGKFSGNVVRQKEGKKAPDAAHFLYRPKPNKQTTVAATTREKDGGFFSRVQRCYYICYTPYT